ncbi:MAG: sel1 repeat family protein [Planctomycetales bacterium]|nr:sel1 repeat family protein [bacterium]UNM09115.1 MAG: sel1 repeat family protein [Planctomycetales bacterium]
MRQHKRYARTLAVVLLLAGLLLAAASCRKAQDGTAQGEARSGQPARPAEDGNGESARGPETDPEGNALLRQSALAAQYGILRPEDHSAAQADFRKAYENGDNLAGIYLYYLLGIEPGFEDRLAERTQIAKDCLIDVNRRAKAEEPEAQYLMSLMRLQYIDEEDSRAFIDEQLQAACADGNAAACYLHGELLAAGDLGEADHSAAEQQFEHCVGLGCNYGHYGLSRLYGNPDSPLYDLPQSIEQARIAAAAGNHHCMEYLAFCYYMGEGVEQDLAMTRDYYRQAAELGNAECAGKLAAMMIDGEGGDVDLAGARQWLERIHIADYQPFVDEMLAEIDEKQGS